MKTIKRIISVVLLIVIVLAVCYVFHTCSRLTSAPYKIENYVNVGYCSDDYTVTFVVYEDRTADYKVEGNTYKLVYEKEENNVFDFRYEDGIFSFVQIDNGELFDCQSNKFLVRGAAYD